MHFSEQLINKFQKQYHATYGIAISAERADLELYELAELVRLTQLTDVEDAIDESGNDNTAVLRK
jgi:hypothetical protein